MTQNTHLTYYQRNNEKALAEANEYYENNKGKIKKKI